MTTPMPPDPMGNPVAGAADLQASIDRLDAAMANLTTAITGQNNGNGTTTSPAMAQGAAAQGATFTTGTYAGAGGGGAGYIGGNNGSGGTSGTNPYSFGNAASSILGSFGGGSVAQGLINIGSSAVNSIFQQGAAQLNTQATINAYGYIQAGFYGGNQSTASGAAIYSTFGGGNGGNLAYNPMALNATDAYTSGQMLSQMSDQANYTSATTGPYGRGNAAFQNAAATALANPGLGMTGAASVTSALESPATSYNMMMMGIGTTPLQLGTGKANSIASVEASIGQRFGFKGFNSATGTFDSANLAANLNNPLFQQQMMMATGMTQQQYQEWSQQWAQTNTLANNSGKSMTDIQNAITAYATPGGANGMSQAAAKSFLTKPTAQGGAGLSMSILQSMTQANSEQTGAEAGGNAAFTKGLQDATNAINTLTQVLSGGLQAMSGTTGAAGAIGSLNASGVVGAGSGATNAAMGALVSAITNPGATLSGDLSALSTFVGSSGLAGVGGQGAGSATGSLAASTMTGGKTGVGGTKVSTTGADSSKNTASQNQALAKQIIGENSHFKGWNSGTNWSDLVSLWMQESSWNALATNPQSGAFGIAQSLHGNKHGLGGNEYNASDPEGLNASQLAQANAGQPAAQMLWGLNYIYSRYGSPTNAMQHERDYGWYADGTSSAKPGLALVGERGPELVALSGGQKIINAAQTAAMLQPSFNGGSSGGGGGLSIAFHAGAISINNTNSSATAGYHTSADAQPSAQQLVQAIETALNKSAVLKNIAAGVTG